MRNKRRKKIWRTAAAILLLLALVVGIFLWSSSGTKSYAEKYAGYDLRADVGAISREGTYSAYRQTYAAAQEPQQTIELDVTAPVVSEGSELLAEYMGREAVLLTQEGGTATWKVNVPQAGLYAIRFVYCSVASRDIDAERGIRINGETPFRGADYQLFSRMWTDEPSEIGRTDNQGNEIRPTQIEVFRWAEKYACDNNSGYEQLPYLFYFSAGENTVTLDAISEPLALSALQLTFLPQTQSYAQYAAQPQTEQAAWSTTVQGESAQLRSAPSLYATYDRASAVTEPYSLKTTKQNMIGGGAWSLHGQWIEWDFAVPEDGWYNIAFKARQNYNRGQSATRKLYLDGALPFEEMRQISFGYSNDWVLQPLGDGVEEYRFYLTAGVHTLRMEAVLGEMGATVGKLEDSIFRMNQIYRQLLVVMGRNPDTYRDYALDTTYPELSEALLLESRRLYQIVDEIAAISGGNSSQTGAVLVLADMLEDFSKDSDLIKRRLSTFRDNISAAGTAMLSLCQSQLDIDYFCVKTPSAQWQPKEAQWYETLWHELQSFFFSFTTDYDAIGDVHDEEAALEVWILTGRDQANVLKTIIDDSFTAQSGIPINLKLVEAGAVLSAVGANNGPDILLSAGQSEPVNYALRNAAEDLTQFEDCAEVLARFHESAYLPYVYADGVYALPETQTFSVLFYRTDVLAELELGVPETWEDLENMLPVLQHANMEIGLPDVMNKTAPNLSGFYAMMLQNGSTLYDENGAQALLDDEGAIRAFEDYCAFYTNHGQPRDYNFADRFRSGEMPIGVAEFTLQNTLAVFAPELKGLWSFSLIPGTVQEDGTVDHSVLSSSSCSMMLKNDDAEVKADCWEFLKWWTSAETQARFGREMECLMGASARYATANLAAFDRLSWSSAQLSVLEEQRSYAKANREVAGGYYTSRHIINAMRKVVNEFTAPRETLLDYNQLINDEIKKKRTEFGLD